MTIFKKVFKKQLLRSSAYIDFLNNGSYISDSVQGFSGVQIGISPNQKPVILIEGDKTESRISKIDGLSGINASFGVLCSTSNNSKSPSFFNIIEFLEEDSFLDFFFDFFEEILKQKENRNALKIREEILNISKLFSFKNKVSRKSMMGLWSEIFIIYSSQNPDLWIDKWPLNSRSTFDFDFSNIGLDVKSFGGHNREHFFSIEQLHNQSTEQTLILSICLKESDTGESIFDLLKLTKSKLREKKNIKKLETKIFKKAGKEIQDTKRFNMKIAKSTLCVLRGKDIPSLNPINTPLGVSEIKFKSDCSNIKGFKFDKEIQERIEKGELV